MHISTHGPYKLRAIHYFPTERGSQVRSITVNDCDGNDIGMTFDHLSELRAVACGFPLAANATLCLELDRPVIRDPKMIKAWLTGTDIITPVNSGAMHVAGTDL